MVRYLTSVSPARWGLPVATNRRLLVVALVHAVVSVAHGLPHDAAGVTLAAWQYVVVAATVLGPVAVAVFADRSPVAAGYAFATLMVVSVAFGVTHHWLLANPDNVRNVSAVHRGPFEASAVALAVVGAVGALVGYSSSSR
jgi:hypothetical protein